MVTLSGGMTGLGIGILLSPFVGAPATGLFPQVREAGIGLVVVGLLTAPFMPWM